MMNEKRSPPRQGQGASGTIGITIRPEVELLRYYERITERANQLRIANGQRANLTVQQVMLYRLRSLPAYQAMLLKKSGK